MRKWIVLAAADKAKTTYKLYTAACVKYGQANATAATSKKELPATAGTTAPMAPVQPSNISTSRPASAAPGATMKACAAQWQQMKASGQTKGMSYSGFSKTCLNKS